MTTRVGQLLCAVGLVAALIGIPLSADAAKPPKPKPPPGGGRTGISVRATPNPVVFGRSTTVSGGMSGQTGSVSVDIQTNPYPYAGFTMLKTVASDTKGDYSSGPLSFPVNTKVRAVAHTSPPRTSSEVFVNVRIRVSLSVGDSTPRRGQRVRFSGLAFPQHDGRLVYIQRRSSTGSYVTVAKTRLRDNGDQNSKFSRRLGIFRDGVFRVKVTKDADHATGVSSRRALRVH